MKKLLSLALALVLVLGLSVTAFATDPTPITSIPEGGANSSKDVTAGYTAAKNDAATVYYFTIKWENTANSLKYTGAKGVYIWDGASMTYTKADSSTEEKWEGSATYKITVTNQSNTAIYATTETANTYNLTLTGSDWRNEVFGTADTDLVSTNNETGLKTYTTGREGSKVEKSLIYTYTARTIGAGEATAPDYTTNSTITVGKITVTVKDTNA